MSILESSSEKNRCRLNFKCNKRKKNIFNHKFMSSLKHFDDGVQAKTGKMLRHTFL